MKWFPKDTKHCLSSGWKSKWKDWFVTYSLSDWIWWICGRKIFQTLLKCTIARVLHQWMGFLCFDTSKQNLLRHKTQFYLWYVAGVVIFNWWRDMVKGNALTHQDRRCALVSYPANVCPLEWFPLGRNEFETAVVPNTGMLFWIWRNFLSIIDGYFNCHCLICLLQTAESKWDWKATWEKKNWKPLWLVPPWNLNMLKRKHEKAWILWRQLLTSPLLRLHIQPFLSLSPCNGGT